MRIALPCIQAEEPTDCGPAALATVARYFGLRVSITRVRELVNTDLQGTDLENLMRGAEVLGFNASSGTSNAELLSRTPLPAIVHFSDLSRGHFVVVYSIWDAYVLIADPSRGILKLSRDEFLRKWTGHILILAPSENFTKNDREESPLQKIAAVALSDKRPLLWSFGCSIIVVALGFALSFFVQILIDRVLPERNLQLLSVLGLGLGALLLFHALAMWTRRYFLAVLGREAELSLGRQFLQCVLSLPTSFYDRSNTGEISSRVDDIRSVRDSIVECLLVSCVDVVLLLCIGVFMFHYSARLTLIVLSYLPSVVGLAVLLNGPMKVRHRRMREQFARFWAQLIENVENVRILKICNAEEITYKKLEDGFAVLQDTIFERATLSSALGIVSNVLMGVVSICLLWIGARLTIQGRLTIGQLVFFYSILGLFLQPVENLMYSLVLIQEGVVGMERLNELSHVRPELESHPVATTWIEVCGQLEFANVHFSYRNGYPVLTDVNLTVGSGETIAIMGETGSGKSSLAYLCIGLYEPTQGSILINGRDINSINRRVLRSHATIVMQDPSLMSGTIKENIALGHADASLEQIQRAAQLADAHDFIMRLPTRYEYQVGVRGLALSSGQRQRIAIARALLRNPQICILDEATSNLDVETEASILASLQRVRLGKTTIIISHRFSAAMRANRIIILDRGRIIENGSHRELIKQGGKYSAMWDSYLRSDQKLIHNPA